MVGVAAEVAHAQLGAYHVLSHARKLEVNISYASIVILLDFLNNRLY